MSRSPIERFHHNQFWIPEHEHAAFQLKTTRGLDKRFVPPHRVSIDSFGKPPPRILHSKEIGRLTTEQLALKIHEELQSGAPSWTILEGPSGAGKSTALLTMSQEFIEFAKNNSRLVPFFFNSGEFHHQPVDYENVKLDELVYTGLNMGGETYMRKRVQNMLTSNNQFVLLLDTFDSRGYPFESSDLFHFLSEYSQRFAIVTACRPYEAEKLRRALATDDEFQELDSNRVRTVALESEHSDEIKQIITHRALYEEHEAKKDPRMRLAEYQKASEMLVLKLQEFEEQGITSPLIRNVRFITTAQRFLEKKLDRDPAFTASKLDLSTMIDVFFEQRLRKHPDDEYPENLLYEAYHLFADPNMPKPFFSFEREKEFDNGKVEDILRAREMFVHRMAQVMEERSCDTVSDEDLGFIWQDSDGDDLQHLSQKAFEKLALGSLVFQGLIERTENKGYRFVAPEFRAYVDTERRKANPLRKPTHYVHAHLRKYLPDALSHCYHIEQDGDQQEIILKIIRDRILNKNSEQVPMFTQALELVLGREDARIKLEQIGSTTTKEPEKERVILALQKLGFSGLGEMKQIYQTLDTERYTVWPHPLNQLEAQLVENLFPASEFSHLGGKKLLELACGQGRLMNILRRKGYHVTGCDLMFELIQRYYINHALQPAHTFQANFLHLPVNDKSIDGLFCMMHSLFDLTKKEELHEFFSEAGRVLKPGSRMLIDTVDPYQGSYRKELFDYQAQRIKNHRWSYNRFVIYDGLKGKEELKSPRCPWPERIIALTARRHGFEVERSVTIPLELKEEGFAKYQSLEDIGDDYRKLAELRRQYHVDDLLKVDTKGFYYAHKDQHIHIPSDYSGNVNIYLILKKLGS